MTLCTGKSTTLVKIPVEEPKVREVFQSVICILPSTSPRDGLDCEVDVRENGSPILEQPSEASPKLCSTIAC